jgi:tetratricopeptide (TPR) repeat protein
MSESNQGTSRDAGLLSGAIAAARQGDLPGALALARQARQAAPRDLQTLLLLCDLLRRAGEAPEARSLLETGKELGPRDPALAFQLGRIYRTLREYGLARREFELVLAQQPEDSAAREALVLVEIAERRYEAASEVALGAPSTSAQSELLELVCIEATARGDCDAARRFGEMAFERLPGASAALTLARAEFHAGADTDAERRLHWILDGPEPDPTLRGRALGALADIADRRGEFDRAYELYAASKNELRLVFERSGSGRPGSFRDLVAHLAASAATVSTLARRPSERSQAARQGTAHVFLLGFPRTGTTLLEQCLGGHPDVVTTDEVDALRPAAAPYLNAENPFAAFGAAREADIEIMRDVYWRRIRQRAPTLSDKVLIDKMPFNSVFAGFIPSLFPEAKLIFAMRDPRDVVFSCFRRRFGMNSATYEFCTLVGSVELFCAVMRQFELTRPKMSSPILDCRYEDVVRDLRGAVERVCEFIGVDWRDDMARFSERAKQRPLSTVSAPQLTQGLYDGAESWRNYRDFLAPHLPDLAPWVSRFGYAPD